MFEFDDCRERPAARSHWKPQVWGSWIFRIFVCLQLWILSVPQDCAADQAPPQRLGAVTALAYRPDGKRLAVGTFGEVVVYDTANWQIAGAYRQAEDTVRSLTFSPDSRQIALGCGLPGRVGEMLAWSPETSDPAMKYPGGKDTVEAIAFRADGKALLAGVNDNTAQYFGMWPAVAASKLDEHNGRVTAVAFSPRTDFVFVTGGMDRIVKVWDPATLHTVVNFDQSEGGITGLAFLPNGAQFVGSSLDGKLYWWGINFDAKKHEFSGYLFRSLVAHDGGVTALAASADGKRLATCGADYQVDVWNIDGGKIKAFKDAVQPCYAVAISPDGKTVAAGGRDGLVYLWDVEGNKLLTTLTPPPLPVPPPVRVAKVAGTPAPRSVPHAHRNRP